MEFVLFVSFSIYTQRFVACVSFGKRLLPLTLSRREIRAGGAMSSALWFE